MKHFITFGGPTSNYHDANKKICNQAVKINLFDKIVTFTEKDLMNDNEFWKTHSDFILKNKRGYGYWIWKSYLIKKYMETLNNNDVLLYLDSGCEINYHARNQMKELLDTVDNFFVSEACLGNIVQIEKIWTKKDLLIYMNMDNDMYINKGQIQGGILLIKKNNLTTKIINEWYQLASMYHNINDMPSIVPNYDCFKEHRHDQSVISLLLKKYNAYNIKIKAPYSNFKNNEYVKKNYINIPIWAPRNKTGICLVSKIL